jgi:hypothetical protein
VPNTTSADVKMHFHHGLTREVRETRAAGAFEDRGPRARDAAIFGAKSIRGRFS